MSYPSKNVSEVKEYYQKLRIKNEEERTERLKQIYSLSTEIKSIDAELSKLVSKLMAATSMGKEGIEERIQAIKQENEELLKKRADILSFLGFPADYTNFKYKCNKCNDTGYCGFRMCECMKTELIKKAYENSGLGGLLKNQSFTSFSLDFYQGEDRVLMEKNLKTLYHFANNIDKESGNFLFVGPTGVGKTHLSTSVAKYVLDSGHYVVYDSAQNIFNDFQKDRFKDFYSDSENVSDKYLECELLIIDDLGTEIVSNFTVSCLYNIINTRINKNLSTIINTNLDSKELRKIYQDRITSRLFGEFIILLFKGKDIRKQKIN